MKTEEFEEQLIEGNKLIADYVGLEINYFKCNHPMEPTEWDLEITFPDFFDHDEQLMYLYDVDRPQEHFRFHSDWNWLMPVVRIIKYDNIGDDWINTQEIADQYLILWDKITDALAILDRLSLFLEVVNYLQWRERVEKKNHELNQASQPGTL